MDLADLITLTIPSENPSQPEKRRPAVCCDNRRVGNGDIFVAVAGTQADGHDFIPAALAAGARYIVAEKPCDVPVGVELIQTPDTPVALAQLAHAYFGNPARRLLNLGVTGTNGKTTVAYLAQAMLKKAGIRCGLLGTVAYDLIDHTDPATHTTPDAPALANLMDRLVRNQAGAVVMECSSHALDQERLHGLPFRAAAFTNLSGDHLDYHGDADNYLVAKIKLFTQLDADAVAVINADDPASERIIQKTRASVWRYGLGRDCDISAEVREMTVRRSCWRLRMPDLGADFEMPLIGRFNIYNALAAAGLARAAGVGWEAIAEALAGFSGVPGRLEQIEAGQDFTVLVDYAHTDDALNHVLQAVREVHAGRLILVFGCGGDRDRSKRPRMAQVAQQWADRVVLTSDNPRNEDPEAILHEIQAGFSPDCRADVSILADRSEAIASALREAAPGDVVLVAGKGHEAYQEINGKRRSFDDREICRSWLQGGRPAVRSGSFREILEKRAALSEELRRREEIIL